MLETRHAALAPGGTGPVRVLAAAARLSLRMRGLDPAPKGEAAGAERLTEGGPRPAIPHPAWDVRSDPTLPFGEGPAGDLRLGLPINRCAGWGDRMIARLGPDEWLVLGPEADADLMVSEMTAELAGRPHAVIDVSHRSVAIEVAGPDAEAILNAGCPLDLHPAAFPAGSATRTLLGKAEIVLLRPGSGPAFRVECWRSFAAYVHAFLIEADRALS